MDKFLHVRIFERLSEILNISVELISDNMLPIFSELKKEATERSAYGLAVNANQNTGTEILNMDLFKGKILWKTKYFYHRQT
jgi:hypothetical protein